MKPGCLWIGVSRLNSLMSNEVQALIKVFPHRWGIHNNALIWEQAHPPRLHRRSCCCCLSSHGRSRWVAPQPLTQLPTPNPQPGGAICLKRLGNTTGTHTEPQGTCFPKTAALKSFPETSQLRMLQGGHLSLHTRRECANSDR